MEADAYGIAAVVHSALAHHPDRREYADLAVTEADQAIELRRPDTERRSLVFDTISAAVAYLLTEGISIAAGHALTAVNMAGEGLRSVRAVDRLDALWTLAEPHADDHPDLAEFGSRLRALHNNGNDDCADT